VCVTTDEQEQRLKSISVRANYIALMVSIASIVGAVLFLLLIQLNARQEAHLQIEARARMLTYVFGEQVQFYRRIFQRLAERQEVIDLLFLDNEVDAVDWSKKQNRLLPDSVGMALVTSEGRLLGNPAEHYVGKVCLLELKDRVAGKKIAEPPVHTAMPKYAHFDFVTEIRGENKNLEGMLFASISTDAIQTLLENIVRDGEVVELRDGHGQVFLATGNKSTLENAVTLSRPVPNTGWTMRLSFNVPATPLFYYWSSIGIIVAALMFAMSVIYLMRYSLNGLMGEMNSIRHGLISIIAGTFDGALPRPRFKETADTLPAIERISKMIYERNQVLQQISETDELTGLYNRRRMMHELKRVVAQSARGVNAMVVSMDLDHFKHINDKYGHATGDKVLEAFAQAMKETRRDSDIVGRFGGDEFIAVLIEPSESAEAWYQRLSENLQKRLENIEGIDATIECSISAGAISLKGMEKTSVEEVLKLVDDALYAAKADGRARLVLQQVKSAD
jgi:diguanylate cyclase (GGDEF)-like protein